jgi:TatA/E family protein of Tat protein translocase
MWFAFIGPIGWNELVIILVIVLVIFGPKRLPELAEAMGKSIRKFKSATREVEDEVTRAKNEVTRPAPKDEEKNG